MAYASSSRMLARIPDIVAFEMIILDFEGSKGSSGS